MCVAASQSRSVCEPHELAVVELGADLAPVRHVDADEADPAAVGGDEARVTFVRDRRARRRSRWSTFVDADAGEDRDAVPLALAVVHGLVAERLRTQLRERLVGELGLLEAEHVDVGVARNSSTRGSRAFSELTFQVAMRMRARLGSDHGQIGGVRDQEFLAHGRAHVGAHVVEPVVEARAADATSSSRPSRRSEPHRGAGLGAGLRTVAVMHRRTALTVTGAIALTLAAGSAAMAADLGILDSDNGVDVGDLSPVGSSSSISTPVTVDDDGTDITTPGSTPGTAPGTQGTTPGTVDDRGTDVTSPNTGTTPNTVGTTTPNTIDDHGGDDDHSGPGRDGDDSDDNSGSGHGGDDGHDNSGPGSSDD